MVAQAKGWGGREGGLERGRMKRKIKIIKNNQKTLAYCK